MSSEFTLFMTPEESARIQSTVLDRLKKCKEQAGQPREARDPKSLIQEATSSSLMEDLQSSLFGLGSAPKKDDTMVAYATGYGYLPCTAELKDLQPMKLSELRMETHHRGRALSLRRVSPVVELKASSWAVMQGDSPDEVERLELFLHKSRNGRDILDSGYEMVIKEPYYTLNNQGDRTIRVDHLSDLVILSHNDDPEAWRNRGKEVERQLKTAAQYKEEGNAALQKKQYSLAHACYTKGLALTTEAETLHRDLYRNRSHVNLVLKRYDEAKTDALSSLTAGESPEQKALDAKAYFRAGNAAYSLGSFADAKSFFEEQQKLDPDNQYAKLNLRRINIRFKEQQAGSFDLNKIVGSLSKTQGLADVADYHGRTEVKDSPGAGRGLYATKDIDVNDIVMAEKAFCVAWSHEPESFSALTCDARDNANIRVFAAGLHKALLRKLEDNPSQLERVLSLCGNYKGLGVKQMERDGMPIIDSFQLHDIVQSNGFGLGQQTENEDVSNASTGIWTQAALINHSCVPNLKRDCIGDFMIVRATRKIRAGEELTHSYDEASDLDARAENLQRTWGFVCRCALCKAEEADGLEIRKKRKKLEDEVNSFAQKENPAEAKKITVSKAKRLRQNLYESYDEKRYKDLPRRSLFVIDHWLKLASSR